MEPSDSENDHDTFFDEDDDYIFSPEHLLSRDENLRRWAIIEISRTRLTNYEEQLLKLYPTEESYANRRHIIRALGSVGSNRALNLLTDVLKNGDGLIVGDAVGAIAKLGAREAIPAIKPLVNSPVEWVANQARHALKALSS